MVIITTVIYIKYINFRSFFISFFYYWCLIIIKSTENKLQSINGIDWIQFQPRAKCDSSEKQIKVLNGWIADLQGNTSISCALYNQNTFFNVIQAQKKISYLFTYI